MITPQATLEAITQRDPDGRDTEPTESDRESFRNWAIKTYGRQAWREYRLPWAVFGASDG